MRKWGLPALCAVLLLLACVACGAAERTALTVNGVPVSQGVFALFKNEALRHPEQNGLTPGDAAAAEAFAETQCRRLAALDHYLKQQKISLRFDLKSDVATRTEGEWALFRAHYLALGMQKPDLTRIHTFEAQKKQLVQFIYGAGGKKEVSASALRKSFLKLYVGFKAFEASLTTKDADSEVVSLDEKAQEDVLAQFRQMAARANSGTDLDTLYAEYCETQGLIVTAPLAVSLMKDGDPMYDAAFFAAVQKLEPGSTGVIRSESSVYLLQRVAIDQSDGDAFEAYRDEVLYHEKLPAVEAFVAKLGEQATLA